VFEKKERGEDRVVRAIRQRRAISAWDRVLTYPGFHALNLKLRKFPDSDQLDLRRQALAEAAVWRRWPDSQALAESLLFASSRAPDVPADVHVNDVPEARWGRAPIGRLMQALSVALPSLPAGFALLLEDERALLVQRDPDGQLESSLLGEWDAEITQALAS
jgi:hypothetical protein